MKTIIIRSSNQLKPKSIFERIIYIIGYTLILITTSVLFNKTIYIDNQFFGLFALIASVLIYLLNQFVKPFLVFLTLPITALTFGLFYPFINVFILKIVDLLMGDYFYIDGFLIGFVVAIFISAMNYIMQTMIINPLIYRTRKGAKKHG